MLVWVFTNMFAVISMFVFTNMFVLNNIVVFTNFIATVRRAAPAAAPRSFSLTICANGFAYCFASAQLDQEIK